MNKYLLLRDNKQSGPYSVDELAIHGLKAYDLVWLEGKSAAWRYPSEIEELKPFAPVVEEQPFDRFYKKPDHKTIEPALRDNTRVNKNSSSFTDSIKKTDTVMPSREYSAVKNSTKKIHVSLPGIKDIESTVTKSSKEEFQPDRSSIIVPVEKLNPVAQPVCKDEPVARVYDKKNDYPNTHANSEEIYRKSQQKESLQNNSSVKEAPVSKLLFRSVAAACLLLAGALIGLIINYNSQQKKFQQLNQLVQEIRHQDNPGIAKAVKNENISGETIKQNVQKPIPSTEQPAYIYKEDISLPVTKKNSYDKKSINHRNTTVDTQQNKPAVVPVILTEEPSKNIEKLVSEVARKNLWQLVSVDHNTYKTGVFGGISNLSLKLSNKSLFQLEQVEVEITYLSPEKKPVNKQKVVFENVSPGEQLTISVPKSSRGVKIDYAIKKISTKEFGLAHAGM